MEQHTIFIDSRERSSGTDSAFEVTLRESVHLQSHRLRVDHCRFVDSFFTTDLGKYVYYKDGSVACSTLRCLSRPTLDPVWQVPSKQQLGEQRHTQTKRTRSRK